MPYYLYFSIMLQLDNSSTSEIKCNLIIWSNGEQLVLCTVVHIHKQRANCARDLVNILSPQCSLLKQQNNHHMLHARMEFSSASAALLIVMRS
jgi:hypothetical protein